MKSVLLFLLCSILLSVSSVAAAAAIPPPQPKPHQEIIRGTDTETALCRHLQSSWKKLRCITPSLPRGNSST